MKEPDANYPGQTFHPGPPDRQYKLRKDFISFLKRIAVVVIIGAALFGIIELLPKA